MFLFVFYELKFDIDNVLKVDSDRFLLLNFDNGLLLDKFLIYKLYCYKDKDDSLNVVY